MVIEMLELKHAEELLLYISGWTEEEEKLRVIL
jgi:hypothetical protein